MDVRLPNGKILRGVPDGTTKAEIMAKYGMQGQDKPSLAKTVFDQGMQGATFGFADEATDRIGSAIAALATDQKYGDLLKDARSSTKEQLAEQLQKRPVASILSNIAGGALVGGLGATTGTGAKISNSLRSGNIYSRSGKGALAGMASGALYGAGTGDDGQRGGSTILGGLVGGLAGGAAPIVVNKASGLLNKPITSEYVAGLSNKAYQRADRVGGVIKPQLTDDFIKEIQKLTPQTSVGKTVTGDTTFTNIIDRFKAIKGQPISLRAAQELDEFLSETIDGLTDAGKITKQGKKVLDVQSTFRTMIENADESLIGGGKEGFNALKEGRKLWSQSRKLSDIERIIQRAEMTDNPATSIKAGFRTLANNPKRMRGYTKKEAALIRKAAKSGVVPDAMRTIFSSRLLSIGATLKGGPLAGAVAGLGTEASRSAATNVQLQKAAKLAAAIAKDIPPPKRTLLPQYLQNPAILAGERTANIGLLNNR